MATKSKSRQGMRQIPFSCIVKPVGARCNLRCEHCFYLDKHELYETSRGQVMTDDLLERLVIEYIASQPPETRELTFMWQGGEPTLAGLAFFQKAVRLQARHAPSGMSVSNALQTNGTLLDGQWAAFLKENNFLVGLSLDGPQQRHDRFRIDVQGHGSWARAMEGVRVLRQAQVEYNILCCVQSDNVQHPRQVYEFLKEQGTSFLQFIPIIEHEAEPPSPTGPQPPAGQSGFALSDRTVSGEQFGRFMIDIFNQWLAHDVGRIFIQFFDSCLGLLLGHPAALCVHSRYCGRGVVLEHNGDVYSCDHYVFPGYRLGNIRHRPLRKMVDSDRQNQFGRGKENSLPEFCQACFYRPLCHGGCPAHRTDRTADGEFGLNHLCIGYLQFYRHAMPVLQAMGRALRHQRPATDWKLFLQA